MNINNSNMRIAFFKTYKLTQYRTIKLFDAHERYIIDFNLYHKLDGTEMEVFLVILASNTQSRTESYTLFMNHADLSVHFDKYFVLQLFERDKLIRLLESSLQCLTLQRRHLYRRLELVYRRHERFEVSFANEYKNSRTDEFFIEKRVYEHLLVCHQLTRIGTGYVIVSVYRHIIQDRFEIRIQPRSTFKVYSFHMSFSEVNHLVNLHTTAILKFKYPVTKYLIETSKDYREFVAKLHMLTDRDISDLAIDEQKYARGIDKLSVDRLKDRMMMQYLWANIVKHIQFAPAENGATKLSLLSFKYIIPQYLVSQFWPQPNKSHLWVEIKLAKNTFSNPFTSIDSNIPPSTLLDLELYVGTKDIPSLNVSSEKVRLNHLLKVSSPAYQKIILYVDQATNQVRRVLILDAQGNKNRFEFNSAVANQTVEKKEFEFTPPAGTKTVKP